MKKFLVIYILLFVFSYSQNIVSINTDKSQYHIGDSVNYSLEISELNQNYFLEINYYHLSDLISTQNIQIENKNNTWAWVPPETDFKGYLTFIRLIQNGQTVDSTSIAVDVSSDWSKFPRYGFLSDFSNLSDSTIAKVIENLTRHHVNGIQFYDWHYKHHKPLKGTVENPSETWLDIANRTIYLNTIEKYIDAARNRNIKTMAYNLIYGATETAESDGIQTDWFLFKDRNASSKDFIDLSFWGHQIFVMNPVNVGWQNYLIEEMRKVFTVLNFDGWHIDQLGDRGSRYDFNGNLVDVGNSFGDFINNIKSELNVEIVMNAVNQYGQSGISTTDSEFLYTEVWPPNDTFSSLANILLNNQFQYGEKKPVIAGYVNHDLSDSFGYFNNPAVLFTDAVIFAFGGAHIELGEHMLGHEYFPNNNLQMDEKLRKDVENYYDFSVAYQNLLRDGGIFQSVNLSGENYNFKNWPPKKESIALVGKKVGDNLIMHLINFTNATTLEWTDNQKIQVEPDVLENIKIDIPINGNVKKLWAASPDFYEGKPADLTYSLDEGRLLCELPKLKYWNMLVIELDGVTNVKQSDHKEELYDFQLFQNYPNPFNPETVISFKLPARSFVNLKIYDVSGKVVETLINEERAAGVYSVHFNGESLSSGVYFYMLNINGEKFLSKQMLLLK